MLGLDIMLDEELNPWLLEINTNPGLHLVTDVVNEHHPTFVKDMFKGTKQISTFDGIEDSFVCIVCG